MDNKNHHNHVFKIASDIIDCINVLKENYKSTLSAIDDDNPVLHKFCGKLEYLLENSLKDSKFLGLKKNYWDYFYKGLTSDKQINDCVKFVKCNKNVKTPAGKGRGLIRFCLVHQSLADTLQQCLGNETLTKSFYDDYSILNNEAERNKLLEGLYDLNEIKFDLSPISSELDVTWPTCSSKLGNLHQLWAPISHSISTTSLASASSQFNNSYSLPNTTFGGPELDQSLYESLTVNENPELEELKIQLDELTHESEKKIENLNSVIDEKDAEIMQLKDLVELRNKEINEVKNHCDSYSQEVEDLREQLEAYREDLDQVQTSYSCCKAELDLKCENEERLNQLLALSEERFKAVSIKDESVKPPQESREMEELKILLGEKSIELSEKEKQLNSSEENLNSLRKKYDKLKSESEIVRSEISALKFKVAEEAAAFQESLKKQQENSISEVLDLKSKLSIQEKVIEVLEKELQNIRNEHEEDRKQMLEGLENCQALLERKEIQLNELTKVSENTQKELAEKRGEFECLKQLSESKEKGISSLEEEANLLRSSVIELIKQKDKLWQANEKLLSLQQIRVNKWVPDNEVAECSKCGIAFSFMVRKHHCRLCGRIFCYSCSNNVLPTTANRECRVCDDCYAVEKDLNLLQISSAGKVKEQPETASGISDAEYIPNDYDVIKDISMPESIDENNQCPRWDDFYSNECLPVPVADILAEDKHFTLTVNAGSMKVLPIMVDVDDCVINWELTIDTKCLGVMITYKSERCSVEDSSVNILLPSKRLAAQEKPYKGRLSTKKKLGLYKFHLDNTYSKMTPKTAKLKLVCNKTSTS